MRLRRITWLFVAGFLASAVPSYSGDTDKFFPSNTKVVITLNVKQMLESPLVKKDLPKIQEQIKSNAEAQKRLSALGFDPLKDLDTVSIAAAGVEDQEQMLIVARGKFDTAKFKAMGEEVAKEKKDNFKAHQVDGQTIYEVTIPQQPRPLFMALVDGTTIVAGGKKNDITDALAIQAGKKQSTPTKELQGLLSKANPKQSLSVVVLGAAIGNGVPFGDKVEHISGGITVADSIQTDFVIATKDAESAKGLAEMVQAGLEQGKQFVMLFAQQQKELAPAADLLEVLKVDTKDNSITIKGVVTKEALEKLEKSEKEKK
jgi:hypothetical protein